MDYRIRIKFEESKHGFVRSIICINDRTFIGKQPIHKESDRIDPLKRAKQKAFVRSMHKVIGYMVDGIRTNS